MEEALLQLVNKSIEQRKFAKNWKPQLVKPLHKKKKKTLVGNFRPVSNLVEVGKVAEYAVAEQIILLRTTCSTQTTMEDYPTIQQQQLLYKWLTCG